MSDADTSHQRLIENELLVRDANEKVKLVIESHTPAEEQGSLPIDFYCECSSLTCQARVTLTLKQYEQFHSRNDRFVIAAGHLSPSVEKVVATKPDFLLVEKHALPA